MIMGNLHQDYLSGLLCIVFTGCIILCGRQATAQRFARTSIPAFDSLSFRIINPYQGAFRNKSLLSLNGGYTGYHYNYRSNIDTPYAEQDIAQHNITGQLQVTAAGVLPFRIKYWVRKSNSAIFRDIADVQVVFEGGTFRNSAQAAIKEQLLKLAAGLKDTLTEKLLELKRAGLAQVSRLLGAFTPQSLIEAQEILVVPDISFDPRLPDSANRRRADSVRQKAAWLLKTYADTKARYDAIKQDVDSLQHKYEENVKKIARYRQMVNGSWKEVTSIREWKYKLKEYELEGTTIPYKHAWISGVRNFSLGRSVADHSELTAKNISINGISFAYQSWYYLAVLAGTVNYRFRDFAVNRSNRSPQYMYLVRGGVGKLEDNHLILSYYSGRKQLFIPGANSNGLLTVSGITAEMQLRLNPHIWLTTEIARSASAGLRTDPSSSSGKFDLSDKTRRAIAARIYAYLPLTGTRLEGFYKHTGANFQSFSNFQTNAVVESWYIKAEQPVFKRMIRLAAAVRKNEFSNPFLVQSYRSNTIFKSITATVRVRRWPLLTAGYQPMSQLTVLNGQVAENRFQALTATLYYQYKIKDLPIASTAMLNRFYNTGADTGFVYYNASSFYLAQNFFFKAFTANVAVSITRNPSYSMQVLEGAIQPYIPRLGTVTLGVKIHNYNAILTRMGGYVNANVRIGKADMMNMGFESGYLPGFRQGLTRNTMASVQYTKYFKPR